MKRLALISAIALSGLFFSKANAQVRIHVGLNLGPVGVAYSEPVVVQQPVYDQPEVVYNNDDDDYYYLPDVDAYYDVDANCYYYNNGYNWVSAAYLPGEYRYYDWRSARRFEIRERHPFMRADFYRSRFNGRPIEAFRIYGREHYAGGFRHDDRFNGGYSRDFDRRDDRFRDGYNRDFDRRDDRFNHGGFNRNDNFNRQQPQMNNEHFGNRGGDNRPSNQNWGGRDNKGGDAFARNNMVVAHRGPRF